MRYKIVQKQNRNAVYATFDNRLRATKWLAQYDSRMWDDKSVKASDLEIVGVGK